MPTANPKQSTLKLTRRQHYLGKLIHMTRSNDQSSRDECQANDDLMADMFWGLFSVNDIPIADELPEERRANAEIMRWLRSTSSWNDLRLTTGGSLALSALGAEMVYAQMIKPQKKGGPPESAAGRVIMKQAQQAQAKSAAQQMSEKAQDPRTADSVRDFAQAQANQARQKAMQASREVQEALRELEQQVGPAHTEKKIADELQEVREAMTTWGIDPGNPHYDESSLKRIVAVAKLLMQNDMIKSLTQAMGRAKGIAMAYRSKIVMNRGVVVDGGFTQDPMRLAPQQLASILPVAPHALRAIKVAEFGSRGLEGMIEGHDGRREGNLIIAVDASGSMDGERSIRANGAAVGLALAARDTGQGYTAYKFSERIVGDKIDDQSQPEEIMTWACYQSGGGTSFDIAIERAIAVLKASGPAAFYSDFVMITDGECQVSDECVREWKKTKKEFGQRMIVLLIGENTQGLKKVADHIIIADDQMSVEKITERIAEFLASSPEDSED